MRVKDDLRAAHIRKKIQRSAVWNAIVSSHSYVVITNREVRSVRVGVRHSISADMRIRMISRAPLLTTVVVPVKGGGKLGVTWTICARPVMGKPTATATTTDRDLQKRIMRTSPKVAPECRHRH